MTRPVIVIGGGGHASVVIDALALGNARLLGLVDPALAGREGLVHGIALLGGDEALEEQDPAKVILANGIGSTRNTRLRTKIFLRLKEAGFVFTPVVHPAAIIAPSAILAEGAQVMAGAVVQPGAVIGADALVNTRASVDHDCRIGAHCHIAPGVTLSGGVTLGEGVHVGSGAVIIQGITIGEGALVAAGAIVTRDVPAHGLARPPLAYESKKGA